MSMSSDAYCCYADHNSSAYLLPEVREYLLKRFKGVDENTGYGIYANPNSSHALGRLLNSKIEKSRMIVADALSVGDKDNVVFNSGATEGIANIFWSAADTAVDADSDSSEKKIFIISKVEHKAVIETASYYQRNRGIELKKIDCDKNGTVRIDQLQELLSKPDIARRVALVSIMAANNETGVISPFEDIAKICSSASVKFFSDTTQLIGKEPFCFEKSGIDFAVLSAHKLGSLVGCGAILLRNRYKFKAMIMGGGQESELRSGTQNYIGVESLGVAMPAIVSLLDSNCHLKLKEKQVNFEREFLKNISSGVVFGHLNNSKCRVGGTTLLSLPGVYGAVIQQELERAGVYVSTAAACSDASSMPSHVLSAMGVNDGVARGAIRISIGLNDLNHADLIYSKILQVLVDVNKKNSME